MTDKELLEDLLKRVETLEAREYQIQYQFSVNSRTVSPDTLQQMEEKAIKDLGLEKRKEKVSQKPTFSFPSFNNEREQ